MGDSAGIFEDRDRKCRFGRPGRRIDDGRVGRTPGLRYALRMTPNDLAELRDAADPLRGFRSRFALADDLVYLDGNSLGAQPVATAARIAELIRVEWSRDLVTSWNRHDWIGMPRRVGGKIARVIGAADDEVIVADSTSVNLFKLLVAGWRHRQGRPVILTEPGNFPTDLYIAQGAADLLPGCVVRTVPADHLIEAIDDTTAIVMLTHVHYKSGRRLDVAEITRAAHARNALVLWDLSHSVGAVPVDLEGCDVDLAVGCGYKYLNGGPGAPAFLFVARHLQDKLHSPLSGWMGHAAPFAFGDEYRAASGVDRFLCGTPPILSMAALETGVDLFLEAPADALFAKAEALSTLFMHEIESRCGDALELLSPTRFADRGSHLSYAHPEAEALCQALIARGVIGDFRAPDAIRFGFAPLYTRFADVIAAAAAIEDVLATRAWDQPRFRVRGRVT
jgi:kynureninase